MKKHPPIPPPEVVVQPSTLADSNLTQHAIAHLRELQAELSDRRIEALRLYEPMSTQDEIHSCMSSERIVLGGNRSGKSCATFVEDARAATGQDPYGKYPKRDGVLIVVGRNWPHIGLVAYAMLFRAGAFRIIRDLETNKWRAYRPLVDFERIKESKPAPPLIPQRFVQSVSWVLKSAQYCQRVELTTGWVIHFFSSEGEPPQGYSADLVHIDEDVSDESWIGECLSRLADRKGRFIWSAMPHSKNDALLGLCERAERAVEKGDDTIKKFVLRFLDNPHIDKEEKQKNLERWSAIGQDELRMRAEGEFTTDSVLMYPSFNSSVHMIQKSDLPDMQVPKDWTRYVAIDPGHAVMACLFGAVPPDEKYILVYDELYIRNCNALIWGERFAEKIQDQSFYAWILDMHGGSLRDLGSGRLPHELYTEQLRTRKLRSVATGYSFIPGSDDIPARTALVRQMLHIRGDGSVKLKFLQGACPELMREIKRYKKKVTTVNGQQFVTDAPNTRGDVHAVQCLEYLAAYEPKYHRPPLLPGPEPWYVKWLADKKKRLGEDSGGYISLGPMGKST